MKQLKAPSFSEWLGSLSQAEKQQLIDDYRLATCPW